MIQERFPLSLGQRFAMLGSLLAVLAGCGQSDDDSVATLDSPASPPVAVKTSEPEIGSSVATQSEASSSAKATTSVDAPSFAEAGAAASAPVSTDIPAEKKKRDPIYVEDSNGKELIAAALRKAQRDHKHVLIEWGGNWCGWCYKLHDVFHGDETVRPIIHEEFILVLIDQGKNNELMLEYGGADRQYSFPHLTILDSTGQVLTNQETGSLEEGPRHDPQLVASFLTKWMPEKQDAGQVLAAALQQAAAEDKSVLMHVGTPYCGWCMILAQFLQDHETLIAKDFVPLHIDAMRMTNAATLTTRLKADAQGGVPWMMILDESGNEVISSFSSNGNIGYPYQPGEIEHFIKMLSSARKRLTDDDLESLSAALTAYRETKEQAR